MVKNRALAAVRPRGWMRFLGARRVVFRLLPTKDDSQNRMIRARDKMFLVPFKTQSPPFAFGRNNFMPAHQTLHSLGHGQRITFRANGGGEISVRSDFLLRRPFKIFCGARRSGSTP